MLGDDAPITPLMNLASGVLRLGEQKDSLLDFIAEQLLNWKSEDSAVLEEAEDLLTSQLSDFLNEAAHISDGWSWIHFQTERPDAVDRTRRLDMAAKPIKTVIIAERPYTRNAVLLPIECKRLPAPKPKHREREYVASTKGTTGGIQRFKLGKHAGDHALAAMIGYVQKGRPVDWFTTVNGWISALASGVGSGWTNEDCLTLDEDTGEVCRLTSHHDRGSKHLPIELRHLWISLDRGT